MVSMRGSNLPPETSGGNEKQTDTMQFVNYTQSVSDILLTVTICFSCREYNPLNMTIDQALHDLAAVQKQKQLITHSMV